MAPALVQLCVIFGEPLLGRNTGNLSACLMAEVGRTWRIVNELGALLLGAVESVRLLWCRG